ncbi:unnamed protein product [Rangifer tarandus platyrhynchus]|uniref:Uncharacterized protein n=1 Tax=Rangifer tarandus platyrhynchus TaxID=3082113 RepID=A0AC59YKI7_RANTA
MSFSSQSTFSNYRSLGSVQSSGHGVRLVSSAASVYAGAGGSGSRISVSHSTSVRGGWGSGNLGAGMAGGLVGVGGIQGEKETMQDLNDRLASYLEKDLSKITADIRAQYDELAQKNREELDKYWSQQIEESTTVVTTQTAEIGAAEMTLTELRRTVQSLEIDLDSMRNLKASLENSLREVEACYAMQMEQLNGVLLHLESELAQTRAEGQRQTQEYKALLNVKAVSTIGAAAATCFRPMHMVLTRTPRQRTLLDGGDKGLHSQFLALSTPEPPSLSERNGKTRALPLLMGPIFMRKKRGRRIL